MSCIVVQLGQCGNQVGQRVFDTLIEDTLLHANASKTSLANQSSLHDYIRASLDRFFIQNEHKLTARALAIDTELKVIEQLMHESSQAKRHWKYEKKCVTEGQLMHSLRAHWIHRSLQGVSVREIIGLVVIEMVLWQKKRFSIVSDGNWSTPIVSIPFCRSFPWRVEQVESSQTNVDRWCNEGVSSSRIGSGCLHRRMRSR